MHGWCNRHYKREKTCYERNNHEKRGKKSEKEEVCKFIKFKTREDVKDFVIIIKNVQWRSVGNNEKYDERIQYKRDDKLVEK